MKIYFHLIIAQTAHLIESVKEDLSLLALKLLNMIRLGPDIFDPSNRKSWFISLYMNGANRIWSQDVADVYTDDINFKFYATVAPRYTLVCYSRFYLIIRGFIFTPKIYYYQVFPWLFDDYQILWFEKKNYKNYLWK